MATTQGNEPNSFTANDVLMLDDSAKVDVARSSASETRIEKKRGPSARVENLQKSMELDFQHKRQAGERLQKDHEQIIEFRRNLSRFAVRTVALWQTAVFAIVLLQGFKCWNYELQTTVLITLLSTTTVNVFGFLYIVMKFVFPNAPAPLRRSNRGVKKPAA